MAKTVQETVVDFDDEVRPYRIHFSLKEKTATDDTLIKRLQVQTIMSVTRDDGLPGRQYSHIVDVDDGDVTTFSAGDSADLRALLLKIVNDAKAAYSLS